MMGRKGLQFVLGSFLFLGCATLPASAQNLVSNGGFETGDLSGWTITTDPANTDGPSVGVDNSPLDSFSGSNSAIFYNSNFMDQISQSLPTQAGGSYTLTFELAANPNFTPDSGVQHFEVFWDGNSIFDRTDNSSVPYQEITVSNLTANDISTLLIFSGQNEPGAYYLDDVSLTDDGSMTGVPEPSTWVMGAVVLAFLMRRLLLRPSLSVRCPN